MEQLIEEWKDIEGYEGYYQISSFGNVYSFPRLHTKGGLIKPSTSTSGYLCTHLSKNGIVKTFQVHRLVGNHFLDNPNNLSQINHKDENKINNRADNLEFCDQTYNVNYGTAIKRAVENHNYKESSIKSAKNHDYVEVGRKQSKPVLQYALDGTFIKRWESARQIFRELNYSPGNISSACNNKIKSAYGYRWIFEEDINE